MAKDEMKIKLSDFSHTNVVIDNSLLAKAFLEEEESDFVRKLLKMGLNYQVNIMAPSLIFFELVNVLSKALKDPDKTMLALNRFKKFVISIVDPEMKTVSEILKDVCSKKISYYDASYHALAKDFDATFLTADREYYEIMKDRGNIMLLE